VVLEPGVPPLQSNARPLKAALRRGVSVERVQELEGDVSNEQKKAIEEETRVLSMERGITAGAPARCAGSLGVGLLTPTSRLALRANDFSAAAPDGEGRRGNGWCRRARHDLVARAPYGERSMPSRPTGRRCRL
jgi:hypothetical protein